MNTSPECEQNIGTNNRRNCEKKLFRETLSYTKRCRKEVRLILRTLNTTRSKALVAVFLGSMFSVAPCVK